MAILVVIQTLQTRQLTDMQKLLMDIYFHDGHTYEFMVEFFSTIFPEEKDLVVAYIDELYTVKLLSYIGEQLNDVLANGD